MTESIYMNEAPLVQSPNAICLTSWKEKQKKVGLNNTASSSWTLHNMAAKESVRNFWTKCFSNIRW